MKRTLRSLLVLVVLSVWVFVQVPSASGSKMGTLSDGAPQSDSAPAALQDLASCVESRHSLLVDFLIDTSASIRSADPGNDRVAAAQAALVELRSLETESTSGAIPKVLVAINGYSVGFEPSVPWTPLTGGSLPSLQHAVALFSTENYGVDSDDYSGLEGIKQQIDQETGTLTEQGGSPPCEAVMWFAGPRYTIQVRDSQALLKYGSSKAYARGVNIQTAAGASQAVSDGESAICATDGLADQIHEAGIALIAFQLAETAYPEQQNFVESIVSGKGDSETSAAPQSCGADGSIQTGAYIPSYKLSDLAFIFDQAVQEIGGGNPTPNSPPIPVCASAPCASGERTFQVPSFFNRFNVTFNTGGKGIEAILKNPAGSELVLNPRVSSAKLGTVTINLHWINSKVGTADVDLPGKSQDWIGQWSLTFVDTDNAHPGAFAQVELTVFGNLTAKLLGHPHLVAGSTSAIGFHLVTTAGEPATLPPADIFIGAVMTNPLTQKGAFLAIQGPDPQGNYVINYPTPLSGATSLDLLIEVTVSADGIAIQSSRQYIPIPVNLSATFPQIQPSTLSLSSVLGVQKAHGRIEVFAAYGGCVSYKSFVLRDRPAGVKTVSIDTEPSLAVTPSCTNIKPDSRLRIIVSAQPSAQSEGEVQGTLNVLVRSSTGRTVLRSLPVEFSMRIPVNQAKRAGLFLLLLLLGILIPLLILMALNFVAARFRETNRLLFSVHSVGLRADGRVEGLEGLDSALPTVATGAPVTTSLGRQFRISRTDFNPSGIVGNRSRAMTLGGVDLMAHVSWNPFQAPYGIALVDGSIIGTNGPYSRVVSRGRKTRIDLSLPGVWLVIVDSREALAAKGRGWGGHDGEKDDLLRVTVVTFSHEADPIDGADVTARVKQGIVEVARGLVEAQPESDPGGGGGSASPEDPQIPPADSPNGYSVSAPDY